MNFRFYSDIHLEFAPWEVPPADNADQVLILAGDICPLKKAALGNFLEDAANKYTTVLYVPGNHEFYGAHFELDWLNLEVPANVVKLQNKRVVVNGQGFVGATLWTDLNNPVNKAIANNMMNDYRVIRTNDTYKRLHPNDTTAAHFETVELFTNLIQEGDVVITHHLPTYKSVDKEFAGDVLNPAYATELDWLIEQTKPVAWIHGHSHFQRDYMLAGTRILANPRGYPGENNEFDPLGVVNG